MFLDSKQETLVIMIIKPQDTLIALKYCSIQLQMQGDQINKTLIEVGLSPNYGIRDLAEILGVSSSEISKATKRLEKARLVTVRDKAMVITRNLFEWLVHGMRYYCPLKTEGFGRAVATGWNCPLLQSSMVPPKPGWGWANSKGDVEAELIAPFHVSVPIAARHDPWLYQALSLVDVLRGGKPRELVMAETELSVLMGLKNGQS